MSNSTVNQPDDSVISVHEAGHLIVGLILGRKARKVSIDVIDGKRGCFWDSVTGHGWDEFSEMRCLLAGPRAQVSLLPSSIAPEKLPLFTTRIIQPSPSRWTLPERVYDFTGWEFDVRPVYEYLSLPDAPANEGVPFGTTHTQVVARAEEALLRFFSEGEVKIVTKEMAERLLGARLVSGEHVEDFVAPTGLLSSSARSLLLWS